VHAQRRLPSFLTNLFLPMWKGANHLSIKFVRARSKIVNDESNRVQAV